LDLVITDGLIGDPGVFNVVAVVFERIESRSIRVVAVNEVDGVRSYSNVNENSQTYLNLCYIRVPPDHLRSVGRQTWTLSLQSAIS
jgi:hypothetical protein